MFFSSFAPADRAPTQPETSALFAAPEVMQSAFGGSYDGKLADLWSCGIVLYIMLYGRHPFMRDQVRGATRADALLEAMPRSLPLSPMCERFNMCTWLLIRRTRSWPRSKGWWR